MAIDLDGPFDRLKRLAAATARLRLLEERELQLQPYGGLLAFVRYFWPIVEPARPLIEGWPLQAICEHLEAITRGEIRRLCISVPPGFMKSLTANVFWPAFEWGPMDLPSNRFIAASYSQSLTVRDNVRFRNIIMCPEYRQMWGNRFAPSREQFNIVKVANDQTGWKLATSVGGVGTGERGDRFVVDDGNSVKEAESDVVRDSTNQWFTEVVPTRLNSASEGAIINIQQRTHDDDITGMILSRRLGYELLRIPMEYDSKFEDGGRKRATSIGWTDPRNEDGELAWPERFPVSAVKELKEVMGPYAVAGQFQQNPSPRGGGIIKQEWWQLWEADKFPECEYRWASADTAYTEKEENDPTGFTVWGLFYEKGNPKVILLNAWRKRLDIHGPLKWTETNTQAERKAKVMQWRQIAQAYYKEHGAPEPAITPNRDPWLTYIETGENTSDRFPGEVTPVWEARTQDHWGLCEWMAHSCRRFKVHRLIIEGKASGLSVAQELRRLHGSEGWVVQTTTPEGDKAARLVSVQGTFSAGMVYAPERLWSDQVIEEVCAFPRHKYKDLTDSTSQALKHVRDLGLLLRPTERALMEEMSAQHRPKSTPLYPGAG